MVTCPYGSEDWVCQPGDLCFRCDEDAHDNMHWSIEMMGGVVEDCRTCKLRSVQLNPRTIKSTSKNDVEPRKPNNSWEKGVALDHRGVPYLDWNTAQPIPVKQFAERRSVYEEGIRHVQAGVTVGRGE